MSTNKMTKKDYFNAIRKIVSGNEELTAFIDHELDLLAKKNSAEKKPTANQLANRDTARVILDTLSAEDADGNLVKMTITDMQKANADLALLSNQRISAIVRQLIADGKVRRTEDKRKAYFCLAD